MLKGDNEAINGTVRPDSIFFASCDGVKCRRICKPGEVLEMRVRPKRIRHPLAVFEGEIKVGDEKTALAEEIKLTFDYYPTVEGADGEELAALAATSSGNGNGKGNGSSGELISPPRDTKVVVK